MALRAHGEALKLLDLEHYGGQAGIAFGSPAEALAHYRETGHGQGLSPHPLFDTTFYVSHDPKGIAAAPDPLTHYLEEGARRLLDPSFYFDAAYYASQLQLRGRTNPLLHYVEHAWTRKARDPNPLFSNRDYAARVLRDPARETPLEHFLRVGIGRRAAASPAHDAMLVAAGVRPPGPLARRPARRPHAVFLWTRARGAEIPLEAGEVFQRERGLARITILSGTAASAVAREEPGLVVLDEFLSDEVRSRPAALRLLIRSLAAAEPPFAFTDHPDGLPLLRVLGVPAFLLVLDGDSAPVEMEPCGAERVVFASRSLVPADASAGGRVAVRPYRANGRATGSAVSEYARALLELAARSERPCASGRGSNGRRREVRKLIALCSDWSLSGVNTTLGAVGGELRRQGWDVEILFSRSRESVEASAASGALMPSLPYRYLRRPPADVESMWEQLIDEIEDEAPCLVLTAYDFVANSIVPALSSDVGVLLWLQSDEDVYYEQASRLGPYANALVCVSERIKQVVETTDPDLGGRAHIVHNSTVFARDVAEEKTFRSDELRLIYTGRLLQYQKRVLDFVELADALEAQRLPFTITLAGELSPHDEAMSDLPRVAARHLDAGAIRLVPRLSRSRLAEEFRAHDFFVLLSDFEGLPLSLVEAMAAGCVPVVADVESGVDEVVRSGENGVVMCGRDYSRWADVLAGIWCDPARFRGLSARAQATVYERFTVERGAAAFDGVLRRAAEEVASQRYRRPPPLQSGSGRAGSGDVLPPTPYSAGTRIAGFGRARGRGSRPVPSLDAARAARPGGRSGADDDEHAIIHRVEETRTAAAPPPLRESAPLPVGAEEGVAGAHSERRSDEATVSVPRPTGADQETARLRAKLIETLWGGADPFAGIEASGQPPDLQGWNSQHALLAKAMESRPRVVVEVGVWKGASVAFMAKRLQEADSDGVVIAVDTWLGSWEHWKRPEWRTDLRLERGYPTLYRSFQQNIADCGLIDYVLPLPLDSLNAAGYLRRCGISADMIHIDAGHEYQSVLTDLKTWWELLRPGGTLVADDYDPAGKSWPRVKEAIDAFVSVAAPTDFEALLPKALMRKPDSSSRRDGREPSPAPREAGDEPSGLSPPSRLEARLNVGEDEAVGLDRLWPMLNERLRYFAHRPAFRYTVRPWSDSGRSGAGEDSVALYRWRGGAYECFLGDRFFERDTSVDNWALDRAFDIGIVLTFLNRFGRDEGEVLFSLTDYGHPQMVSFSGTTPDAPLVPDPSYIHNFGHEAFATLVKRQWIPWEDRERVAIWRGGLHGSILPPTEDLSWLPRAHLCARADASRYRSAIDTKLVKAMSSSGTEEICAKRGFDLERLGPYFGERIESTALLRYRYQIDIDGYANSWRGLFEKLLTGSVVLKVASRKGYRQWYYDRLKPWVNYVPVHSDLSDLDEALEFVLTNDAAAEQIGMAGRQLALSLSFDAEIFGMARVVAAAGGSLKTEGGAL